MIGQERNLPIPIAKVALAEVSGISFRNPDQASTPAKLFAMMLSMAVCISFTCLSCGFSVENWDEGNPYVESPDGKRHYFYHPCEEEQLEEIVGKILGHIPSRDEVEEVLKTSSGNESDYLCTGCLKLCQRDPERDELICRHCGCGDLTETGELGGRPCPSCKSGVIDQGEMTAIS